MQRIISTIGVLLLAAGCQAHINPRPLPTQKASMARWLAHENVWGVVATTSIHLNGTAFGNVMSFSDGEVKNSTGRLFFYLSLLDPTAQDLQKEAECSVTLSEEPLGCPVFDAEDPNCAKVTFSGKMKLTHDKDLAQDALFSRHSQMKMWPAGHNFQFYELNIEKIFLLDAYGGAADIPPKKYFAASPGLVLSGERARRNEMAM